MTHESNLLWPFLLLKDDLTCSFGLLLVLLFLNKKTNSFQFLSIVDPLLVTLGSLAEEYPQNDPHAAIIRLRQFGNLLGRITGQKFGVFFEPEDDYSDLLDNLKNIDQIPNDIINGFDKLRVTGNNALHSFQGDFQDVKKILILP